MDLLGSPIPTIRDPGLEEESLKRPGIWYRAAIEKEALLREILSDEEKDTLVETHEVSTQTPGAGPSVPNNARVLEMVLYRHNAAAYKTYTEYIQECAEEEARRVQEHQEGCWWPAEVENDDEVLPEVLD